ncbi:serine protease [Candidatus Uhrbacteria bacterium]|nr:serine protease [Candidatus Uhrbacteria bacterium]
MPQFRWKILKIIFLSSVFGLISGILGGLIIAGVYAPVYGIKESFLRPPVDRGGLEKENDKIERANLGLVTFYVNRGKAPPTYDDQLGYGAMLTSDGWAVTTSKVARLGTAKILAVTGDRAPHQVESIIYDTATDAAFLRIKGERFAAVGGGSSRELSPGAELLAVDYLKNVYRPKFLGINYINGEANEIQSSEKTKKSVFVSGTKDINLPGGPLFDEKSNLVGVLTDPLRGTAIPFEYLSPAFRELLRQGKIARPFLGVNYIDLGATLSKREDGERGALIASSGGRRGAVRGGPAQLAGLEDGDVILKIDDDELTAKISLSERIAEYPVGASARFAIRRKDGREETKEITLKARP